MLFDIDPASSTGDLLRADEQKIADLVHHQETARFLWETGIPHCSGLFLMTSAVAAANPGAPGGAIEPEDEVELDAWEDRDLLKIGYISVRDAGVYIDRDTGVVYVSPGAEELYEPVNADVSAFAYTLLLIAREIPGEDPDQEDLSRAEESVRNEVGTRDSIAFAQPDGLWSEYFDSFLY
ncbi:SUKH-4 family immunity protein [Peterkaempfera bronchialis]|uniref:SUKH-4 family immunity protein n=1 Tax=Peterkaempfera bronchialis TaxID=2126346 RepID=UPI0013B42893|nr:SUKH-4 family immunity protein [Peterkaempfera bronchialis]